MRIGWTRVDVERLGPIVDLEHTEPTHHVRIVRGIGRQRMRFGSPREALAYMYRCHAGPQLARMRTEARDTSRTCWDHVAVGALLYGPRSEGCCGVERGSALDLELQAWALTTGAERTGAVLAVERRLRRALRAHGLKRTHPRAPLCDRLVFVDADGVTRTHTISP